MTEDKDAFIRVLIIDDNPDDRLLVIRELDREFGRLQIEQVRNQTELDKALDEFPFDVAVTDYQLLWSNGIKVTEEIKKRFPWRPVIMFTATGNEEIAVRAMKAGLSDYVLKSQRNYNQLRSAVSAASGIFHARTRTREVENRLQDLLNRLNVGVFRADLEGKLFEANPGFLELLGIPREEPVQSLDLRSLFSSDAEFLALTRTLQANGHAQWPEMPLRKRNERVIWASLSIVLNRYADGKLFMDGLIENVTERKRAEEALKQSEDNLRHSQKMEAIGRLAGGIAHDFNNILTAINGYSDLLLHALDSPETLMTGLEEIKRAGGRAASLTRQLLMFSRKQILQPDVLDLNQLLVGQNKMLRRLIGENIELVTLLGCDLPLIKLDAVQLEQIILNLVINARDAINEGGIITIETAAAAPPESLLNCEPNASTDWVLLSVKDNGSGMDKNTLSHIFEPFFTTKPGMQGTGMGLASVYGIVKQNNGCIQVTSEPGEGTTFRIYFPASSEKASSDASLANPAKPAQGGTETVLLAEDEEAVRNLIMRLLTESGYRVLEAHGGDEALNLCQAEEGPIDLLITDLVMPRMSGRELAMAVHSMHPDMPILYISGYTEDIAIRRGISSAEVHFLAKPFTAEMLRQKVRGILDLHRKGKQYAP